MALNLMVYGKHKNDKRYGAVDLRNGKIGVGLVFASLISEEKVEQLKEQVRGLNKVCPDFNFEIRYAGTNKKVKM